MHHATGRSDTSRAARAALLLTLATLILVGGCGSARTQANGISDTVAGLGDQCRGEVAQVAQQIDLLTGSFEQAAAAFGGLGGVGQEIGSVRKMADDQAESVCSQLDQGKMVAEEYQRYASCLDATVAAAEDMKGHLAVPQSLGDVNQASWALQANTAAIRENLRCEKPSRADLEKVVGQQALASNDGAATGDAADRGFAMKKAGAMHLVAETDAGGELADQTIALEATLLCQRRQPDGSFQDVPRCNHATLTEGDRVKFGFATDQAARVYLFLYNDTGQFQMVFPAPGIDNEAAAGQQYFLPAGDDWLELDAVGGVTEYVHLVAATHKVVELERLRGADIAPGEQPEVALRTRGVVEPVMTRGFDLQKAQETPIILSPDQSVSTVPVDVEALDVVGVEFEIIHE